MPQILGEQPTFHWPILDQGAAVGYSAFSAKTLSYWLPLTIILFFLMGLSPTRAQTFGNEWINYNQSYYKIPVVDKGVYQIRVSDLQAAGFPVNAVNPQTLQLYHRGKEQAIVVSGEEDGRLDESDYVEFYGKGNDGTQDSLLYLPNSAQPHKYYNLYSDTTAYFLTWRNDNQNGKRMARFIQANVLNFAAETHHREEVLRVYTDQFSGGQIYPLGTNQETVLSQWDNGEGWTGTLFNKASNMDLTFSLPRLANVTGVKPRLEMLLVGRNNKDHNVEVFAGASTASLRSLGSVEYKYFGKQLVSYALETSDLSVSGNLVIRVRPNGYANEPNDRNSICYVRIVYPQTWDMTTGNGGSVSQKYFYLAPNASNRSYIEIANPPAGIRLYDITDPNTVRTIGGSLNNGKFTAMVNNTLEGRVLFATTSAQAILPMRKAGFRPINPAAHNYLVISHKALMKPAGGFPDAVRAYAGYRASPTGGGYDTLVVDTDLLCNQFNYGEFSPLAIRRFADYMLRNGKPQFLFLIGRSWYPHFGRKNPYRYLIDLVPTGGYPGSDIMLTAGLNGTSPNVPALATGRLNVPSGVTPNFPVDNNFNQPDPAEVISYLNKVKEHEASPRELWQKNLLHLSGGKTPNELNVFRQFVDGFKQIAESSYLGGKVATISKKTDNAVEFINVVEEVNKGLGVLTFFGHSGSGITDIDIGYVSNDLLGYRNKGRYPFIMVNGCEAGDIFYGTPSFGSDWIKTPNKGAVLFMAHSHVGYSVPLKRYSDQLYATAFGDSSYIYKPIGMVQKESIKRYINDNQSEYDISNAQQYTLQGDPAIALFRANKPDFVIDQTRVFVQPFGTANITAATDSFRVGIIVANYGITSNQPLEVTIRRTLNNGTFIQYDTLSYPSVSYQDTLYFTIRNRSTTGVSLGGNNRFEVKVDPADAIAELNENNNQATLEYFMPTQGVLALFPREYSIVNTQTNQVPSVSLIAQNADGISVGGTQSRSYLFEIDTTHTFNSPGKRTQTINGDFLAKWETSLLGSGTAHDSTVYYWRVRFADKPEGQDNIWAERSFIYITNSPEGWSQSRFPQFSKSGIAQVQRNTSNNRWEFNEILTKINVETSGSKEANAYLQTRLLLNDFPVLSAGKCGTNALVGVAFHGATALPYSVNNNLLCNNSVPYVANFMYDGNILNANDQFNKYLEGVQDGDYVLLFTLGSVSFSNWTPELKQQLVNLGANETQLANLQTGHPYIILGKKGAGPGSALLEVLPNYSDNAPTPTSQALQLSRTLTGRNTTGTITSSSIGPATEWGTLFRNVVNENSSDNWSLDVIGLDAQGTETLLESAVPTDQFSLAGINAQQYPYLKLRLRTEDPTNQTPPQLRRWQVIYKGVPEGLVNPALVSQTEYSIPDKQEGETFQVNVAFQNISNRSFADSLTLRYTLLNKDTRKQTVKDLKVKVLAAGDTVKVTLPIQTLGHAGDNLVTAFFNPRLQAEEYYENNVLEIPFKVKKDRTHPILDVAFDGVRIMNGDIVSPSPLISVSLKDENKFLIRKDTVGLELFLKRPGANSILEKISFNNPEVRYFQAQEGKNDFRIEYHPRNLSDGIYSLRVQGTDVSGNVSGVEPYQVSFEVITESKITHFYPYPNPFSSKTRFVFTLTGAEIPDQIKIQVMTVTGRVVREITQNELGPIHIGNNVSEYAWDGTDEFGDQLANGVYLYRVIVKSNGQDMDRRSTAADKSFHKDFGKMYILR